MWTTISASIRWFARLLAAILRFLWWLAHASADRLEKQACASCDEPLRRRALWCQLCSVSVLPAPPGIGADASPASHAFGLYGGALADALQRLKYRQRPDLARRLGLLVSQQLGPTLSGWPDVVVAVPLHPRRLARRGFNQAALLARPIAEGLAVALDSTSLERVIDTAPQATLDGEQRRRNMHGAFVVRDRTRVAGKRVLLIDDVATTGATLAACESALRHAGAVDVRALVVACAGSHRQRVDHFRV